MRIFSSASAYNKPAASHVITEGTTLANPYWQYSRNKIACEELLMKAFAVALPISLRTQNCKWKNRIRRLVRQGD